MPRVTVFGFPRSTYVEIVRASVEHAREWVKFHRPAA
jgi:hypothetical protein